MNRSYRRVAGILLAVLALGALGLFLRPAPVSVETAVAAVGPLRETVDEEGQTRVRDRYVVAAPVTGRVARITSREGDPVNRGQVVALMYPAPLDPRSREQALARVAQAEDAARAANAAVAQAREARAQAERDLARARQLGATGMISSDERERAELQAITRQRELESADFHSQAAAHDVEESRAAVSGARAVPLHSPVAGRILRLPERSERVVNAGEPLLEIGDPAGLELVADLLSSDAVRVHPGDPIVIEGWGGPPLEGRLRRVEPSGFTKVSALGVEEQRVNVVADFVRPPSGLGDRFRVELRIIVWEGTVLQVPASAAFRHGAGWAVFGVSGGRARLRDVGLGHRTPFAVEVTRGVQPGDVVIRDPSDRITDGVRVRSRGR